MLNREIAIIVTIAAIMISIPVTYFPLVRAQGNTYNGHHGVSTTNPAGLNMTSASNMTGAAGNTTGGTNSSSIPTTNPAGVRANRL